jgi:hypothetical protein
VLITNPYSGDIDAVTDPLAILEESKNSNPVIPLNGMLYKPEPSPIKEPVKYDAVTSPVALIDPVIVTPVLTTKPF